MSRKELVYKMIPFRKTVFDCQRATLLSIKKAEGKITLLERVQLRYHLLRCDPCNRFIEQWKMLDNRKEESMDKPEFKLSEESKERIRRNIITMILVIFSIGTSIAQTSKDFNLDKGLAIEGYDPVAYFTMKKAIEGNKDFQYQHEGVTYYFSSSANRDAFMKNPTAFEPQYGGWCAYAMGATGEKVEIDPETFKVYDGKLYLFYNAYFNNTLPKWNKDEMNLKTKADKNWKAAVK